MRLALIETGHAPEEVVDAHGPFPRLMELMLSPHLPDETTFPIYTVVDGTPPPSPDDADAFLITGSRHGAYEDHDWIPPLCEAIRSIHTAGKPLVGICFGHQIIAKALGGHVEKYDGGWGLGPTEYPLTDAGRAILGTGDHQSGPAAITLNAVHQDQVVKLPPDAVVLASTPFTANAMLAIGESTLTIQPHPEFSCDYVADLIAAKPAMGSYAVRATALSKLSEQVDNDLLGQAIAQFITRNR